MATGTPLRPRLPRGRTERVRALGLVALGLTCLVPYARWSDPAVTLAWRLFAPALSVLLLVGARLVRRAPLPPMAVAASVALPLLSCFAQAFLSPTAGAIRPALFATALDGTLRAGAVGVVLGLEGLMVSSPESVPLRAAGLAGLGCLGAIAFGLARVSEGLGIHPYALDTEAARALARLALGTVAVGGAAVAGPALGLYALTRGRAWLTRTSGAVLVLAASGPFAFVRPLRDALAENEDPLGDIAALGIDPPHATWTGSFWVQASGTWRRRSRFLVLHEGAPAEYLTRTPHGPLRATPIPPEAPRRDDDPRPVDDELLVVMDGSARFEELVLGISALGARRHGLWLAIAPSGWQRLGPFRRLTSAGESLALGVEPRVVFGQGAAVEGPADPLLQAMSPEGKTVGLAMSGPSARCVLLDAKLVAEGDPKRDAPHLRYTRTGECERVALDASEGTLATYRALFRETRATHVLLAPPPDVSMNEVVGVLGRLATTLTDVRSDEWNKACRPPTLCEPSISLDTGAPLVWLTPDAEGLARSSGP